jgi:hypothetical protein
MPIEHDPIEAAKIDRPGSKPRKKGFFGIGAAPESAPATSSPAVDPVPTPAETLITDAPPAITSLEPVLADPEEVAPPASPREVKAAETLRERLHKKSPPRAAYQYQRKAPPPRPPLAVAKGYRVTNKEPKRVMLTGGIATLRKGNVLTVQTHGQKSIDLAYSQGVDFELIEPQEPAKGA